MLSESEPEAKNKDLLLINAETFYQLPKQLDKFQHC